MQRDLASFDVLGGLPPAIAGAPQARPSPSGAARGAAGAQRVGLGRLRPRDDRRARPVAVAAGEAAGIPTVEAAGAAKGAGACHRPAEVQRAVAAAAPAPPKAPLSGSAEVETSTGRVDAISRSSSTTKTTAPADAAAESTPRKGCGVLDGHAAGHATGGHGRGEASAAAWRICSARWGSPPTATSAPAPSGRSSAGSAATAWPPTAWPARRRAGRSALAPGRS